MKRIICIVSAIILFVFCGAGASAQNVQKWQEIKSYNFIYKIPKEYSLTGSTVMDDITYRTFTSDDNLFAMGEYTGRLVAELDRETIGTLIYEFMTQNIATLDDEQTKVFEKNGMWFGCGYGKGDAYHAAFLIAAKGKDAIILLFAGEKEITESFLPEVADTVVYNQMMEIDEWFEMVGNENFIEFDYRTIARNPEKYKGKETKITGEVLQVMGSRDEGYALRVAIEGDYDEVVLLYIGQEAMPEYSILLDDVLESKATIAGDTTYKTVLGDERTVVLLYANEVEVDF